ncbi:MAG: phospholipase A [Chitinispirillaceae bacterium]
MMYRVLMAVFLLTSVPLKALGETATGRIFFTDPNYTLMGPGSGKNDYEVKFKVGLKYRIFGNQRDGNGLYLSYIQHSFWQPFRESSPFFDNNYKPEIIFNFGVLTMDLSGFVPRFLVSYTHESNGGTGDADRGWDRLIGGVVFGNPHDSRFSGSLSVWNIFSRSPLNSDISRYAGDGEVNLFWKIITKEDAALLSAGVVNRFRFGMPVITRTELSVYYNPFQGQSGEWCWVPFIIAQYVHGTAETLIDYRRCSNVMRVGLAFM